MEFKIIRQPRIIHLFFRLSDVITISTISTFTNKQMGATREKFSIMSFSVPLTRYPLAGVLVTQLMTLGLLALLFALKQQQWGVSVLLGGLCGWLPNALLIGLMWYYQAKLVNPTVLSEKQNENDGSGMVKIAWWLAAGEATKVIAGCVLLIIAMTGLQAVILPLIIGWLSMLVAQILAPIMVNKKR